MFGDLESVIDPNGMITLNVYDNNRRLIQSWEPRASTYDAGVYTEYTYDSPIDIGESEFGELRADFVRRIDTASIGSTDTLLSRTTYDSKGRVRWSESGNPSDKPGPRGWANRADASLVLRSFNIHDESNRQVLSFRLHLPFSGPSQSTGFLSIDRAVYDASGRQTSSLHYEVGISDPDDEAAIRALITSIYALANDQGDWEESDHIGPDLSIPGYGTFSPISSSSTQYNSAGQATMSTDQFGRVSSSFYDLRGNVVRTEVPVEDEFGASGMMVARMVYDNNGREVFRTDSYVVATSGSVVGANDIVFGTLTTYDDNGRVVETVRVRDVRSLFGIESIIGDEAEHLVDQNLTVGNGSVEAFISHLRNTSALLVDETTTTTQYSQKGQVESTSSGVGNDLWTNEYTYDLAGRQIEAQRFFGSTLESDDSNLISRTETIYGAGGRAQYSRTYVGKDSINRDMHRAMSYTYDAKGRIVETHSLGLWVPTIDDITTKVEFDSLGRKFREWDGRQSSAADPELSTQFEYDLAGRLVRVRMPEVEYTVESLPLDLDDLSVGRPVYEYDYDIFGNRTAIRNQRNYINDYPYNFRETTLFNFDSRGREVERALNGGGIKETKVFNDNPLATSGLESSVALGQLEESKDFEGNTTRYFYDNTALGQGRLIKKQLYRPGDILEETVTYKYDVYGRVIEVKQDFGAEGGTDERDLLTLNQYDEEGRLADVRVFESLTAGAASLQSRISYDYDALGRLIATFTSTSHLQAIPSYTSPGTDVRGITTYEYDAVGRLKTVSVTRRNGSNLTSPEETNYAYNLAGEIKTITHSSNVKTTYTYDGHGRVVNVLHDKSDGSNGRVDIATFAYEYDAAHNRTRSEERWADLREDLTPLNTNDAYLDDFNTLITYWTYDTLNRLSSEAFRTITDDRTFLPINGDTPRDEVGLMATRYFFDLASNRTAKQVTTKFLNNRNETGFELDPYAVVWTGSGIELTTYAYNEVDQMVYASGTDSASYGWTNTLQTYKSDASGTFYYTYNARGKMATVDASSASSLTTYRYDDAGGRVALVRTENSNTTTTRYTLDSSNATSYEQSVEAVTRTGTTPNGAVEKEVTNTIGVDVIATTIKTDVNHQNHAQDGTYILLTDTGPMNASTRALINAAAEIVQRMFYDAYGELIADALDSQDPESPLHLQGTTATFGTNSMPTAGVQGEFIAAATAALTDLLYRGESYDAVTRLQYLRARFYDPSSGVFTSFDPATGSASDTLSLLRFSYSSDNPISFVDPTGNFSLVELSSVISKIGTFLARYKTPIRYVLRIADFIGAAHLAYKWVNSIPFSAIDWISAAALGVSIIGDAFGKAIGLAAVAGSLGLPIASLSSVSRMAELISQSGITLNRAREAFSIGRQGEKVYATFDVVLKGSKATPQIVLYSERATAIRTWIHEFLHFRQYEEWLVS